MSDDAKIEIYGTQHCGYCTAARILLKKKGLNYEDIQVSGNDQAFAEMRDRSGSTSVPQIFINGEAVGGFDELYELEESGDLNKLLGTHDNVSGDEK